MVNVQSKCDLSLELTANAAYQFLVFTDEGLKLISSVFGKRSKTLNSGQAFVLFHFLSGLGAIKDNKESKTLSATFGAFVNASGDAQQQKILKAWNGEIPDIACPWKTNKRVHEAMLKSAAGSTNSGCSPFLSHSG